jgi:hypothetical protein
LRTAESIAEVRTKVADAPALLTNSSNLYVKSC